MATVAGGIVLDNIVLFTFGKEPRGFSVDSSRRSRSSFSAPAYFRCNSSFRWSGSASRSRFDSRFNHTRLGKALLAVVQNKDAARLMGINVRVAIALLVRAVDRARGLAGLLIAPLFSVHSDMGTLFGIKAFAVAILGGITSASGVMLAGILYGLIEALVTSFAGSTYTQIVAFAVVILALAVMPNGLLGPRGNARRCSDEAARCVPTPMTLAIVAR